jgi:hypothetical protein
MAASLINKQTYINFELQPEASPPLERNKGTAMMIDEPQPAFSHSKCNKGKRLVLKNHTRAKVRPRPEKPARSFLSSDRHADQT